MTDMFTVAHVAQLHEIQRARTKDGKPGIGPEVEDCIRRLTDGGVRATGNPRHDLVKVLWDLGVGREFGIDSFSAYLETFPSEVPENPNPDLFDRLIAVDRRIEDKRLAQLLNLDYVTGSKLVNCDQDRAYPDTEFIWCQDGAKNRNKSVRRCREGFADGEIGLTAIEGLCLIAQHPNTLPRARGMDLPGSVSAVYRDSAADLYCYDDGMVKLSVDHVDNANPHYGSASRGECKTLKP